MNKSFYQNNVNEWMVIDENSDIHAIKTKDISAEEIKNILIKEDELEALIKEKNILIHKIDKINNADIIAKDRNRFFKLLISAIGLSDLLFLFFFGFNLNNFFSLIIASFLPLFLSISIKLETLRDFGTKEIREDMKKSYEESLVKLNEREPNLIEEISMLKEKYHFEKEHKDVTYIPKTYIPELSEEKIQEMQKFSKNTSAFSLKRTKKKNI